MSAERIIYERIYHVHTMFYEGERKFVDANAALDYARELVMDSKSATIFHLDREVKE